MSSRPPTSESDTRSPRARAATPAGPQVRSGGPAWWRAVRVRQWSKNVLVLAAPAAAGTVAQVEVLVGAMVAFLVFCVAGSGCYLVNDAVDAEADRAHPTKRFRPVAAREIGAAKAAVVGAVLMLTAVAAGAAWSIDLGLTVMAYVALQLLYLAGLKDQPPLDLAVVASGFLLRAIAGGAATGTMLSTWFLLTATFGALFVVTGKRYSEMVRVGAAAGTRVSLRSYSETYLRFVWTLSAGVTVMVYLLWALSGPGASSAEWSALSAVPFVVCLLRYAALVDQGKAEQPEEIVLHDRHLQVLAVVWLAMVFVGAR